MTRPVRFLIGERLYLRAVEAADLPLCQVWINDPDVRRNLILARPMDLEAQRAWHENRDRRPQPHDLTFGIVLLDGDRHIGNTGLHGIDWINRKATTGTLIGEKDCWGHGYATEAKALLCRYAFDTLDLAKLESEVFAHNVASARHLEKNGYVREGVRRQAYFRDGRRIDAVMYGLLADEWRAKRG